MNFNEQDRSGAVTLRCAQGLARWAERCFAALSMTLSVLVGKFHHRPLRMAGSICKSALLHPGRIQAQKIDRGEIWSGRIRLMEVVLCVAMAW